MRKIVHLSDLHFGTADLAVAEMAAAKIDDIGPDVLVVSGDLTQRARSREFREARQFLDRLPGPQIIVPGNHDVPLYNVFARFFEPLKKYQKYITREMRPTYIDDELAIVGINTARSFTIKAGRISEEQIAFVDSVMSGLGDHLLKVIVTHHPFDLPEGFSDDDIVGRAQKAMPRIAASGADVFLAGHLHVSHITTTAKRYKLDTGHSALVIQAGTATSARVRGEAHSFNVIEYSDPDLCVQRLERSASGSTFAIAEEKKYKQVADGWERLD
jgi:3',5'-cyclic AMP phosphodiesterase CpdA